MSKMLITVLVAANLVAFLLTGHFYFVFAWMD